MVVSKDELLTRIKSSMGNNVSTDENISILEDISDTIDDYVSRASDNTNWRAKYDELDANWRKRYTERFFNPDESDSDTRVDVVDKIKDDVIEGDAPETFDDLFEVKKED